MVIVARLMQNIFHQSYQWGQFFIVDKPYDNMLNVGYKLVSQERRRSKDRLSNDQNAQNLFKGLLGKCND